MRDYRINVYPEKLLSMLERLPGIVKSEIFHREMSRFIPQDVAARTLAKPKFYDFLTGEVSGLLQQLRRDMGGNAGPNVDDFEMQAGTKISL